jgi:hypothetical protein
MMQYVKVKDNEELVRDASSSAILNTDNQSLAHYKARKQKEAMIDKLVQDNTDLKKEIGEIKELLGKILGRIG